MKSIGDTIGAFLIGVAVGAVIGILYAPQSGEETRKFISEKGSQTVDELNHKVNHLREQLEKLSKEVSKTTKEIIEKMSNKLEKLEKKQEAQGDNL